MSSIWTCRSGKAVRIARKASFPASGPVGAPGGAEWLTKCGDRSSSDTDSSPPVLNSSIQRRTTALLRSATSCSAVTQA